MVRARRPLHVATILGAAMLVASGCGGGGAETTTAPADGAMPTSPTPGPGDVPGGTASATPQIDPATGLPVDPAAAPDGGAASTASVPDLVGDDVAGGLGGAGNATPIFDAQAVSGDKLPSDKSDAPVRKPAAGPGTSTSTSANTSTSTTASRPVTYSGAKIYVDGIVHTVDKNGTFPKGNPVFRLLSVSAGDIEIALVAGEFTSSGGDGTFLDKGDLVSMVNASEQVTYRVKYLRPVESASDIAF